ncbi:MAG: glycosyltransferase [Candidatus Thermoplasmatota archaeon]|nr:glycosyltransferase [Candidatus Thermoplasmatota archaeon]
MIEILHTLLFFSLAIPVIIFGSYGLILLYYHRQQKKDGTGTDTAIQPLVSVVIATHDEEKVISKKIENVLASNYPSDKLELIFVDDSKDSTPQKIREYAQKYPNIHLIRFKERMGYSPSMIRGCQEANGEIIVLNDAGSFLDTEAIPNLISHFSDPKVGVVTGNDVLMNKNESGGKSEGLYLKFLDFQRTAETKMDSTFFIKGEATATRKNLISDIKNCGETFDSTVGLFVRQKGYKVVYDPNVKFYEYAPSTHNGLVKQKTIRAANLIKVLWRFKHLMFKPELGKYGSIILPMNFAMLIVTPVAIMLAFMILAIMPFFDLFLSSILWAAGGSIFLFILVIRRNLAITFLGLEYSLLKALYQTIFIKKTHDKIDKVASTRRC